MLQGLPEQWNSPNHQPGKPYNNNMTDPIGMARRKLLALLNCNFMLVLGVRLLFLTWGAYPKGPPKQVPSFTRRELAVTIKC